MKARFLKILALMLFCALPLAAGAQNTRTDSIMAAAKNWRDMKNYDEALRLFSTLATHESRYQIALTHYMMGKTTMAIGECKQIIASGAPTADDARLLMAQCRDDQGFEAAAKRIYRQLTRNGNAEAAYKHAAMNYRKGRYAEAEQLAMKAIELDANFANSHLLLAGTMANKGERFKAMMPLYYFLLINTDAEAQRLAYKQLIALWRKNAQAIDILKRTDKTPDTFNDNMNAAIASWVANDSVASADPATAIAALHGQTDRLFRHLLDTSELNLDFWQLHYTDFFVTLVPRNFVMPYVYYISDAAHHAHVLEWIAANPVLFNEFRLWMEAR